MKITEKEFNAITGKETIIERDETAIETKDRLDRAKAIALAQSETETKAIEKAALLQKLGITADEAALLLS
jgi:hypothetical protein